MVDRSGSMSGKKIEQAKGALKFVLNNLSEGDLFNIIAYDSRVESFRPELQRYDDQTRAEALGFVEGIYAGGSTNIDGALQAALSQLQDDKRPTYIVFLTDGLPTAGERRSRRSSTTRARRTRCEPASSPSVSATTSTAACWTSWLRPASARASTCGPTKTSKRTSPALPAHRRPGAGQVDHRVGSGKLSHRKGIARQPRLSQR